MRYGLTDDVYTFNPIRVATHEYAAIIRDVRSADDWPDRFGHVFRGPGWAYERRGRTTTQPQVARAALAPLL